MFFIYCNQAPRLLKFQCKIFVIDIIIEARIGNLLTKLFLQTVNIIAHKNTLCQKYQISIDRNILYQ
jgi:hypothetical protein